MKKVKDDLQSQLVSPLLLTLVAVFVGFLLISNILANRMISLGPWAADAGALTFPITYIISDIMSEVYGYKWSRRVTTIAILMNLILAGFIALTNAWPAPEWFESSYFQLALGGSRRIVAASAVSFLLGDLVNDKIFRRMKKHNADPRKFKLRAITSSVGGNIADTTTFCLIAFLGTMPTSEMIPMIVLGVANKLLYEIIILPITHILVNKTREHEDKYGHIRKNEVII